MKKQPSLIQQQSQNEEKDLYDSGFKKQKYNTHVTKPFKSFSHSNHQLVSDSLQRNSNLHQQGNQSEEEQLQKQARDIVKDLQKNQHKKKANAKMVVGTGFSFDITQFFKFEKKKKVSSGQGDLFTQISGSVFAWIILLYSVLNASMIPAWIMNIKATKLLRISWRFLLQSVMIIPFVLYERRVGNEQVKRQYSFWHIIKPAHLKKVYLSAVATSFWFSCILTVFQWTYVSHGLVLGSLSNFFLSIYRSMNKSNHDLEPGGQVLVVLGIVLVIYDSYSLEPSMATQQQRGVINPFYLSRQWYQRVLADLVALVVSFTMSKFSQYTSDMKSHYPPYLSMLLVNIFMCINMAFSTYFFNGATFDFQRQWGIFSIFTQQHFGSFLYMSIILCSGMFISFVLVSKLFSDPIIPGLAMTLDPILASFLVEVFNVQTMPRAVSFVGYLLIIPGLLLILIGQCLFQRIRSKQQDIQKQIQQEKKAAQIFKQVRNLNRVQSLNEKKIKLKRAKSVKRILQTSQTGKSEHIIASSREDQLLGTNSGNMSMEAPLLSTELQEKLHTK